MTSMKTRILTAVIGIPLVVAVLLLSWFNHWVITVTISAAAVFMTVELLTARKLHTDHSILIPCMLFSFAFPLLSHTSFFYLPVFIFILVLFVVLMVRYGSIAFDDLSFAFTGSFIISSGMACLTYLCAVYSSYTVFFVVLALAVPWMADAGAYFAGTFFGKHKLCPKISPKKTVEGFIGGSFFCIIAAVLVGVIFQFLIYPDSEINFISLIIFGVLDSVISVLGDLSFSVIKRNCKIKDYGSIFPGHGGMLDRCDSVIFTAPLILVIHQLLPVIV